ncbi:MAG TPA: substrate-binding domain-containing protein [Kineosporiaceae bacterium]
MTTHSRRHRVLGGLSLAGTLILAAACSSAASGTGTSSGGSVAPAGALAKRCGPSGSYTIGFAQANNAEPYRQRVDADLQAAVKKYPNFKLVIADGQGDSNKQVTDVENFLTQQVDLLMISPFEAQPLTPVVSKVFQSRIPVIELDRQTEGDQYTAFVGGDNQNIGKQAGTYVATRLLSGGGEVAILEGLPSTTPAIQRTEGFKQGVAANAKIKVVAVQPADWLPDKAQTVFDAMLRANPNIKVVYANNDLMANGAYLALKGQNKIGQVAVIGTDGLPDPAGGIHAVLNGQLTATLVYPTGAGEALDLAKRILLDCATSVGRNTVVPTTLITKDNAQAVLDRVPS